MSETLDKVGRQWLEARHVIAAAYREATGCGPLLADNFAEAVIARLAAHDPPILPAYPGEMKEEP